MYVWKFVKGGPCEQGETAAKTGCTPASGEGGKREGERGERDFKQMSEELKGKLSRTEKLDIERYGAEAKIAASMNEKLRRGEGSLDPEEESILKSLGSVIEKAGDHDPPLEVLRRVELPDEQVKILENQVQGGKNLVLSGVISTTRDGYRPSMSAPSGEAGKKSVVYRITTSKGAPIESISPNPNELEVVLGNNWEYKPTGFEKDEKTGGTILNLEVVNTDGESKGIGLKARKIRSDKMPKEIKTMAAKKRLPKMETWERKMFVKGAPCEKGETTEKTGCTPKGERKGTGAPTKGEPPKKPTKAGTEKKEKEGDQPERWGSLGKDDPTAIKRREQKKKEAAEKKAKKEKESPKLDTMKDVDKYLKKEKKGIVDKAKVAGKKLGKVFIPKGGGKKLRWTGQIWTDGDAVYGGTRTSGPMHGKTGQRIGKKTR
tara:strand:- start:422 stop:1717 length:1296 start_codon:yes stop_codon:yes gene_type:complete